MHVPSLIAFAFFLSLHAAISASPLSTFSDDLALILSQNRNFTFPQPLNSTGLLPPTISTPQNQNPVTCYHQGHRSPPITLATCFPLFATLMRSRGYSRPHTWRVNKEQAVSMKSDGCHVQVINGAADDVFRVEDVVEAVERVLEVCQPEVRREYAGTGGQVGVGRYGFVVRVVGVKGWEVEEG